MDYIRFAIENRVKVFVGVLLIILFGFLSLFAIPIQLVPNVDQPVITVDTRWTGKDPEQIEKDIIEEQEDKLKRVSNLNKIISVAKTGSATITLEFDIGTNMSRAVQEVSDKLREVPSYPEGVDQPVITIADGASQNAIAWMILRSGDPNFDVEAVRHQIEDRVKPYLERADGVSQINVYGGKDREVHIYVDPVKLAQRQISFVELNNALRSENINVSAGNLSEGRLDVRVRTVGQYATLESINNTIIKSTAGGPVRVHDIATVKETFEKQRAFVRLNGEPAIALNAIRETGSNVIAAMEDLKTRLAFVNNTILPTISPDLAIDQVYDETIYIYDAINLVLTNMWVGGTMAIIILILFLRMLRPTIVVAIAIPISVIGTFVVMTVAGRNLNVVSLAGLSFAIGLVVDNAIVVLENIDRHMNMGKKPMRAAYDATKEVWGAILASTLTTLAVFIPVLYMQEEAGQLFRDIALAICAAVTLSLIVSVTVIPSAAARFLIARKKETRLEHLFHSLFGLTDAMAWVRDRFTSMIGWLVKRGPLPLISRALLVTAFTAAALLGAWILMPPTTYLPNGNRNLVFGLMFTPPAYNIDQNRLIGERTEAILRPYWEAKDYADTALLPPVLDRETGQMVTSPPINHFFFVSFGGQIFMGGSSKDKSNVAPLASLLSQGMNQTPGAFAFAFQPSIFGRGVGSSNAIDVEFLGDDINLVRNAADAMFGPFFGMFGSVRPDPGNFNLPAPEVVVEIDRVRASDLGINVAALGMGVQALIDGTFVGDYRLGGSSVDLIMVRPPTMNLTPQNLQDVPLAGRNPDGSPAVVPLGSIARIYESTAPQEIKRIEELRAVTLTVSPPSSIPLQTAEQMVLGLVDQMRQSGQIHPEVEVRTAGTADKLTEVRAAMLGEWHGWTFKSFLSLVQSRLFLALLVVYLLMAALFESFVYPFVIMFAVPLANVGGFIGLAIVHAYVPTQQLDVLTMLGFVILIGIVVNNAILLVYQALNFMKGVGEAESDRVEPLAPRDAIRESVRTRIRPIFMTTLTSVFGMLPLVIMPGAGSELYRGLGSVVVGGLLCSAVFTLLVVPLLFTLMLDMRQAWFRMWGQELPELQVEKVGI